MDLFNVFEIDHDAESFSRPCSSTNEEQFFCLLITTNEIIGFKGELFLGPDVFETRPTSRTICTVGRATESTRMIREIDIEPKMIRKQSCRCGSSTNGVSRNDVSFKGLPNGIPSVRLQCRSKKRRALQRMTILLKVAVIENVIE